MIKFIATLLSALGVATANAQPPVPSEKPATGEIREMALRLSGKEIGLTPEIFPQRAWGALMETGIEEGYFTLVVLADGTTSLYFSTGGGIIGAGEHPKVREASNQFIGLANRLLDSSAPARSTTPPKDGETVFYFLTFDGVRTYSAPEIELGEERDALSPLFHAGHAVITAARKHGE